MNFIKISYTGKTGEGKVFATTDVKTAKENNIYNEKNIYKPSIILEEEKGDKITDRIKEEIKGMNVGEEKTIEIPKELGEHYDPKLIQIIPISAFKTQNINPFPGLVFEYNGRRGIIETVAGGRVRVDFNSEIAGKEIIYYVKIEAKAENDEEKIKYLIERSFNDSKDFEIRIGQKKEDEKEKKNLSIKIPKEAFLDELILKRKNLLVREIKNYLKIDRILFEEEW